MRKKITADAFWITNITKKAIHLGDIGIVIQPMRSLNLLDTKHNSLTRAQLEKSAQSGSLFKKSNAVVVRKVAPGIVPKTYIPLKEDAIFPTKYHSSVELDNIKYEELEISDDAFAEENAESAQTDHLGKWNK
jgi:hypothetical protein